MAIQRWDPLGDLMQLKERMNRLFEEAVSRSTGAGDDRGTTADGWKPPMDVFEQPDRYVLRADLPGVDPSDLEVEVVDGTLTLRGERRMDPAIPKEAYLRVERPYGRFSVQLALPDSVETKSIHAVHKSGVTEVILPKRKRETSPGRIRVEIK